MESQWNVLGWEWHDLISILGVGLLQFVLQVPERQVAPGKQLHHSGGERHTPGGAAGGAAVLCGRLTVEGHIPG